jgi:cytidylate kinase
MVARQRRLGNDGGAILDGRDIGTAVFPDADLKFYLDADPHSRSQRRHRELVAAGTPQELSIIEREVRERDRTDSTRAESPLIRAADAIVIDTTELSPEAVVEEMMIAVRAKGASVCGQR